jgi:hypothetical protein
MRSTQIKLAGVIGYPEAIYFSSMPPFKWLPAIFERPVVVFNYTWRTVQTAITFINCISPTKYIYSSHKNLPLL